MRMKYLIAAAALILYFSPSYVVAQNSISGVKAAVEQVLLRQQEAWNGHDLEGFMSGYWSSPDLTFFSGAQQTSGWQQTFDRYRKKYQGEAREMGKLEFSELN